MRTRTRASVGSEPASSAPCAIWAEGLGRNFSSVTAVDRLSLEVPIGTVFGFLGPNGAGKTTTIRLLLGLLEPTSGRARVLGFDTSTESAEIRQRTGVLLEHSGLIERMSAEDNLEFYARVAHMGRMTRQARIRELLTRLGLWGRRRERISTWSRGTRQKLAVARALLHRPDLVFLDEPTAGLDPVAAAALREHLAQLAAREQTTVFLTTHNLTEAEKLCDRVGVIREGRLLAVGSPAQIRARSRLWRYRITGHGFSDNVRQLVRTRREVAAVSGDPESLVVDLQPGSSMAPLVSFLVRMGVGIEEVNQVGNSLEEVFLSLVNGDVAADGRSGVDRLPDSTPSSCVPVSANGSASARDVSPGKGW